MVHSRNRQHRLLGQFSGKRYSHRKSRWPSTDHRLLHVFRYTNLYKNNSISKSITVSVPQKLYHRRALAQENHKNRQNQETEIEISQTQP